MHEEVKVPKPEEAGFVKENALIFELFSSAHVEEQTAPIKVEEAGDQAAVEQVVEFKFSGPGPSFQMKNRMEAPKRTMIDDDAPEDMDSFEVEGTGAVVEVNLSLGSSGGTGIKAASQNGSPSKAEKTSIQVENAAQEPVLESKTGATTQEEVKTTDPKKVPKNACCTLF